MKRHLASLRQIAARLSSAPDVFDVHFEVRPPARPADVAKAEKKLGAKLPRDLVELYTTVCGGLSFAWSVREGQAYRVRADEDDRPAGQVDLRGPKDLFKWSGTDCAVVWGDGTGDGVALDLTQGAKKAFVTFDHDNGSGGTPSYAKVADVFADLVETACMGGRADDLMTRTLRRFLGGDGDLVKARVAKVVPPPKAIAKKRSGDVPAVLELAPHKAMVTAITAIDEQRVVTASYHEKNLVVRDVGRRAPLGKLVGKGGVSLLFADARGNVVASGKSGLDGYDVRSGAREELARMNPHLCQVELEPDGKVFALSTAFLERLALTPGAPSKEVLEIDGARFVRDGKRVFVLGMSPRGKLTLARVELAGSKGSVKVRREWTIQTLTDPAVALRDGRLALALDDGTLAFANVETLAPIGKVTGKYVVGPGVLAGEAWFVARHTDAPVLDVYLAGATRRTKTVPVPGMRGVITAVARAGDRLVLGDNAGRITSWSVSSILEA